MKNNFTLLVILLLSSFSGYSQGCVAIRGFSSCNGNIGSGANLSKGEFIASSNFTHFRSFRHFRGKDEETERVELGTQVINKSSFLDLSLNFGITDRLYANLLVPFVFHDRSSMYEHGGNPPNGLGERHSTSSSGLADMRMGMGYWMLDPETHSKFNFAMGLGIKLPTGKYDYTDTFYNQGDNDDENIEAVVDQSIQPGDGGFGVTLDLQGYKALSENFLINGFFYYLFNPQEDNGVLTRNGSSYFSCPDQFAARLGLNYLTPAQGLSIYLGGRVEGVPASDLIGSSDGYRRPGYALSIDPGVTYNMKKVTMTVNVPFAIVRNRTQSYQDKVRTKETGVYRHGDAAFADYLVSFNLAYRFGGAKMSHELSDPLE